MAITIKTFLSAIFLLALVLSFEGIVEAGCLNDRESQKQLIPVSITMKGGNIPENVSTLYRYLSQRNILPCQWITVPAENVPLSTILFENRISPIGFPISMEILICSLNPRSCIGNRVRYLPGDRILVPNIRFKSFSSIAKVPRSSSTETFEQALERVGFNKRYKNDADREEIIANAKRRNLGFKYPIYDRTGKESYLLPVEAFQAIIRVAEGDLWHDPTLVQLSEESSISIETGNVEVKSITTKMLGGKFDQVLKTINSVRVAGEDQARVLIADRGFEDTNLFLNQEENARQLTSVEPYGKNGVCDTARNHGTHVWGIIAGYVPDVFEGIARGSFVVPWNFDKSSANASSKTDIERNYGFSLATFLQSSDTISYRPNQILEPSKLNVINLSVGLEKYFGSGSVSTFNKLVADTYSFLYVVAAGNDGHEFALTETLHPPVSAHAAENVLVVTGLDSHGHLLKGPKFKGANSNAGRDVPIVHLAAPGEEIPSICEKNRIGTLSGTSQATAIVSAAAALLFRAGEDNPRVVKRRLLYTAEFIENPHVYWGQLNVARAVEYLKEDKLCLRSDMVPEDERSVQGKSCNKWYRGAIDWGVKSETGEFLKISHVVLTDLNQKQGPPLNENDICRLYLKGKDYTLVSCSEKSQQSGSVKLERIDGIRNISPHKSLYRQLPLYVRNIGLEQDPSIQGGWIELAEVRDLVLAAK